MQPVHVTQYRSAYMRLAHTLTYAVYFLVGRRAPPPPCGRQLSPPCARPMSMQDWYPLATRAPGFRAGVHYAPSNRGRLACVLHIAQGGYQSSIDYLRAKGLSSHFIISEGGSVTQMVPLSASAYANGRCCYALADLLGKSCRHHFQ